MRAAAPRRRRAGSGFTLLEIALVGALVTALLIFVMDFSLDITTSTVAASQHTRTSRRAAALLDRVARDLEMTVLVKKPEALDPLAHPWLFLAESRGAGAGADRLKFVSRSHAPRASALHESDLVLVAYFLSTDEEAGFVLNRWTSPQLPEGLEREFPGPEDEGVAPLARGIQAFGVRFLDEEGGWSDEWDSATLVRSGDLPVSAEISVSFAPSDPEGEAVPFLRQVLLPLRPLDLEALLDEAASEAEDEDEEDEAADGECVTVDECIAANEMLFRVVLDRDPGLAAVIESIGDQCYAEHAAALDLPVEGCE